MQAVPAFAVEEAAKGNLETKELLTVAVNGQELQTVLLVIRREDGLYIRRSDLEQLSLKIPQADALTVEGEDFLPVQTFPGMKPSIDESRQILELEIPPSLFTERSLQERLTRIEPSPALLSGFLNYDLVLEQSSKSSVGGAYLHAGISSEDGLIVNTATVGNLTTYGSAVRLDSYFLHDDPLNMTRLIVGDAITRGSPWSRQTRFGGVRYGTDFSLEPSLVTFPVPKITGSASLPSTVELYVNNALRFQDKVDQGVFSIDQAPLITGTGEVTVLLRDQLGIERQFTSPYYLSPSLLQPGLDDYSLEAGFLRQNYGIESVNYGEPFLAGTYRKGLTDSLTVEGRGEISEDIQTLGIGTNVVWTALGEFGLGAATSDGPQGRGAMGIASFSHIESGWNISANYQRATEDFEQLGVQYDVERIRSQMQAVIGTELGDIGNVNLAYTTLELGDGSESRIVSSNFSRELGGGAFLNAFALKTQNNRGNSALTVGIGFTISFDSLASGYAQADNDRIAAEYRQAPPTDGGWGYRVAASKGKFGRQQADMTWRGRPVELTAQIVRTDSDQGARILASGGLIVTTDDIYTTRRVEGAFGIVEVPDQSNVRVYQENRLIGETDSHGRILIPNLRPYEENKLGIELADLRLSDRMEEDKMKIVPRYFGGAIAHFAVTRDRSATVILVLQDGTPVEAGTPVIVDGEHTVIGYNGEVFISQVTPNKRLQVMREEGTCQVVIDKIPETQEVLPRLGPFYCTPEMFANDLR